MHNITLDEKELMQVVAGADSTYWVAVAALLGGAGLGVAVGGAVYLYNNYGSYKAGVSAGFDAHNA